MRGAADMMRRTPATWPSRRSQLAAHLLILILLAGAWALRLHRLDFQDIWWDEARNISVAMRPLAAIAQAPELDIHPPLYFYGLHLLTGLAGRSAFAVRFFSAWWGLLTLPLVYRLGRGLVAGPAGQRAGLLALALAAVSPFGLAEAQETRMYTLAWALLAAGMLALWSALRRWPAAAPASWRRTPRRDWALLALLVALALLTHYAAAVALATWGLWLLIWALRGPQRTSRLTLLAGVAALIAALCLPVLPIALRQIPGYDNPNLLLPDLRQYAGQLAQAFTLGETAPATVWPLGGWMWLALAGGGALLAMRKPARQARQARSALLAIWLAGGLALFYAILVARSAFDPRYISFVLPPLWALSGWALSGWARLARALPWLAVALLIGITLPSLHADFTDPAYFREDMRGVIAYLQAESTPADIILVDQRYPFGFYWPRWNGDTYGLPPAQPARLAPAQYLFVDLTHDDDRRLDRRLTTLAGSARRIFYVTWFESDMDPRRAAPALLDAFGERLAEQPFRGYTVQVWQHRQAARFSLAETLQPFGLQFEPGVILTEGDWSGRASAVTAPGYARLALRWEVEAATTRPLKASLRLRDAAGAVLAQDDRLLLSDRHLRTTAWASGESALNVYSLPLPAQPGRYTLTLVLYDETTLAAAGLRDGSGVEPVLGEVWVQR